MVIDENKLCPFCGSKLKLGYIKAPGDFGNFWMPKSQNVNLWPLTPTKVKQSGGIPLGKINILFRIFQNDSHPDSYFCSQCNIIITQL